MADEVETDVNKPVDINVVTKVGIKPVNTPQAFELDEVIAVKPNLQERINNYFDRIPRKYDGLIFGIIATISYGLILALPPNSILQQEKPSPESYYSSMESFRYVFPDTAEVYRGRPVVNIEDKPILNVEEKKPSLDLLVELYSKLPQSRHLMMPGETRESVCENRLRYVNRYNKQRSQACIKVVEKNKNNKGRSRILLFPEFKK